MGWAWRSSESYGDKDDAKKPESTGEGRDAEERAADAKARESLWEDEGDWRGYQGPVYEGYSSHYDRSIDDSDERWYRRSSFRYSSYRDYSPSSLFRSAFYTPRFSSGTYSDDNDIKNKAIRALRTLTRNANTVCNRDAKVSYSVQFSAGADSNAFEESLIDGKKSKTIYVCPDDIVRAKTTEDEDAAVDALTGFVLLRVQIAQEFDDKTIDKINKTTLRTLPKRISKMFGREGADVRDIAAEHVDTCLSGMLSKGLLTRLARRNIVKDWGGFAPYLVRHAKKFAAIREKIAEMPFSVESLVGQIAYNMIDDENLFTLAPEIEKIVTEHLGSELAPADILPACERLIAQLRAHCKTAPEATPGPLEQQLGDILEEFMAQHAERMAEREKVENAAKEALQAMAGALNQNTANAFAEQLAAEALRGSESQFQDEINALYNEEQLINNIKNSINELDVTIKALEDASGPSRTTLEQNVKYYQDQIAARFRHFGTQVEHFTAKGVDFEKANSDKFKTDDPAELPKKLAEQRDALKELQNAAQKVIKEEVLELRDKIAELMQRLSDHVEAQRAAAQQSIEKITEAQKEISSVINRTENPHIAEIGEMTQSLLYHAEAQLSSVKDFSAEMAVVKNCRSVNTLRSEYSKFVRSRSSQPNRAHYDIRSRYGWAFQNNTRPVDYFAHEASKAATEAEKRALRENTDVTDELKALDWEVNAMERFLRAIHGAEGNFEAEAINAANSELFKQLNKLFTNSDGDIELPGHISQIENKDKKKLVERLAASIGLSAQQLLEAAQNAGEDESALSQTGREVGRRVRGLLPLFENINCVDDQLFGAPIPVETTVLAEAIQQVNDEARNDPEEEYVAYLSHNNAKPTVRIERPKISSKARAIAKESQMRQRGAIARIREALQFQNGKRTGEVFGVRSGDLDEGGLHKLGYDCEHIWSQKTIAKLPDVAVGILVDQSGSMSSRRKITEAREMCIALAEAVKKIPGVHLHIYGHTANMSGTSDLVLYEHYSSHSDTATGTAELGGLGAIDAFSNNYDGYAIKETAKMLAKDPAKRKYLFVIADGLPHGEGYAGHEARKHVTSVCEFVRERLKIATYAFAVGVHGEAQSDFIEQYGKNHVMFLTTVHACLPQIVRFLRNSLQREKTLVEVSA